MTRQTAAGHGPAVGMKAKVVGRFAALALCVGASAAAAKDTQLNVYNWSDYIAKDTIPNFEKQAGVRSATTTTTATTRCRRSC